MARIESGNIIVDPSTSPLSGDGLEVPLNHQWEHLAEQVRNLSELENHQHEAELELTPEDLEREAYGVIVEQALSIMLEANNPKQAARAITVAFTKYMQGVPPQISANVLSELVHLFGKQLPSEFPELVKAETEDFRNPEKFNGHNQQPQKSKPPVKFIGEDYREPLLDKIFAAIGERSYKIQDSVGEVVRGVRNNQKRSAVMLALVSEVMRNTIAPGLTPSIEPSFTIEDDRHRLELSTEDSEQYQADASGLSVIFAGESGGRHVREQQSRDNRNDPEHDESDDNSRENGSNSEDQNNRNGRHVRGEDSEGNDDQGALIVIEGESGDKKDAENTQTSTDNDNGSDEADTDNYDDLEPIVISDNADGDESGSDHTRAEAPDSQSGDDRAGQDEREDQGTVVAIEGESGDRDERSNDEEPATDTPTTTTVPTDTLPRDQLEEITLTTLPTQTGAVENPQPVVSETSAVPDISIIELSHLHQVSGGVEYVFQPGDNVWDVLNGVWGKTPTWAQLAAVLGANGIPVGEQYFIQVGETIFIPTYLAAIEEPTPIDNLAAQYDTSPEVIRSINPDLAIDGDLISSGQEVRTVPVAIDQSWTDTDSGPGLETETLSLEVTPTENSPESITNEDSTLTETTDEVPPALPTNSSQPTDTTQSLPETMDNQDLTETLTISTQESVEMPEPGTAEYNLDPVNQLEVVDELLSNMNFEIIPMDGYDQLQDGSEDSRLFAAMAIEAAQHDVVVVHDVFEDLGNGQKRHNLHNNEALLAFLQQSMAGDNPYQIVSIDTETDPTRIGIVIDSTLDNIEVSQPVAESEPITVVSVDAAPEASPNPPVDTIEVQTTESPVDSGQPADTQPVELPAPEFEVPVPVVEPRTVAPEVTASPIPEPEEVSIGELITIEQSLDAVTAPETVPVLTPVPATPAPATAERPLPSSAALIPLQSPPNLGSPDAQGYFQIPESLTGSYVFSPNTPGQERWGSIIVTQSLYPAIEEIRAHYPGITIKIGDVNAEAGHVSHVNGVDVDLTSVNKEVFNVNGDQVITLHSAQILTRTDVWGVFFYNDPWVIAEFNKWAEANGFETRMQWEAGHDTHVHGRLKDEFRGPYSGGGAEIAQPAIPYDESTPNHDVTPEVLNPVTTNSQMLRQHADLMNQEVHGVSAEEVKKFLYETIQAAEERGIMLTLQGLATFAAHISSESDFRAEAVGDNGHSNGIFQAQEGRAVGLPPDRPGQIRFSFEDMERDGSSMGHDLLGMMQNPSASLGEIVEEGFDWLRPAMHLNNDIEKKRYREQLAEQILNDLTS